METFRGIRGQMDSLLNDTDAIKFSMSFNLNEFNDLLYLLTELCFLSLDLSFENLTIFHTFSNFQLPKLLTFQNKKILKEE